MALEIILPLGRKGDVKDLVFTILTKEHPLKLIELTNYVNKRYGKSVTFQAVRKAVMQLVDSGVLIKQDNEFLISKEWVKEAKRTVDQLYSDIYEERAKAEKFESIEGQVSVFTFESLNKLMKFWEDLVDNWFEHFKKGNPNINCWQGAHGWEGLLHSDYEKRLMSQLKKKGIISYAIGTVSTPLDRNVQRFYNSVGVKFSINPSLSSFDKSYYVGTYGDLIVQTTLPDKLVKELDNFFKKNKTIEDLNLKELSDIVNRKIQVKLTVIKNLEMAKQINKSIIDQMN